MPDRRNNTGRRSGFERRRRRDGQRSGADQTVVVEITASALRFAVLSYADSDQPDQVKASSVEWRKDAASLNSEEGLQELTAGLTGIIEDNGLQSARFHIVLGGELCVTRTVQGSSDYVRNELRETEERSRLYLSLGPGEKVMVANTQPIDARHDYAVAAVCNRGTLNSIYESAVNAGLHVESIEPALLSVSRVVERLPDVPDEPCLIMHTDANSVELGVYHEGRLLLDYRPGGRHGSAEVGNVVYTHLSRLKRHTGHRLRSTPPELNRVYLCGDDDAVARAMESFRTYDQFEVSRIAPADIQATWELSEDVQGASIVPALGMMLSTYMPKDQRGTPNFMQHIIASAREPMRPVLLKSCLPIAAVLLLGLLGFGWVLMEKSQLASLKQELDGMQMVNVQSREARLKLTAAEQKTGQLRKLIAGVEHPSIKKTIVQLGQCMPSDVWLKELAIHDMQKMTVDGSSILEERVFDFVQFLSNVPGFSDVALNSTDPGNSPSGPVVDFNVKVNCDGQQGSAMEVARNE